MNDAVIPIPAAGTDAEPARFDPGAGVSAVIVATGSGPEMRSARPKPLHMLCGRAMVLYTLDAVVDLPVDRAVVVVGNGAERVTKELQSTGPDLIVEFVEQARPRGTADAVGVGLTAFHDEVDDEHDLVLLPADLPLLRADTIRELVARHRSSGAVCTALTGRPGSGPVIERGDDDQLVSVRWAEPGDDSASERTVGVYCVRQSVLGAALRRVEPGAEGTVPLFGIVGVLRDAGYEVGSFAVPDARELLVVDNRLELAEAESELRTRINERWMIEGVNFVDPSRSYVDSTVSLSPDATIYPGTILQGATVVGPRAEVGPDTHLIDCAVGGDAHVAKSTGRDAEVGTGATVGPFAVLEPGSQVAPGHRTGPFYTARSEG